MKKPDLIFPPARALIAAADSGYLNIRDCRAMADGMIERLPKPPLWVIELSLAQSVADVWSLLKDGCGHGEAEAGDVISIDDLKLGFLLRVFKDGRIGLADMLQQCALIVDSGASDFDPETFYALLNELEAGAKAEDITHALTAKLAPCEALAMESFKQLQQLMGSCG